MPQAQTGPQKGLLGFAEGIEKELKHLETHIPRDLKRGNKQGPNQRVLILLMIHCCREIDVLGESAGVSSHDAVA